MTVMTRDTAQTTATRRLQLVDELSFLYKLFNSGKGARKLSTLANLPTTRIAMTAVYSALATDNSQHGFVKLPSELHLKILSHFLVIPDAEILAHPTSIQSSEDGPDYLARFRVLLSLSRTCQALRGVYLPLCWERLQACILPGISWRWENDLGRGLEIQSEGLMTKSPRLLPLVKIVTVCLTSSQTYKPIPLFAELLANLPSLHTIQIVNIDANVTEGLLRKCFHGRVLPSVRTVILPCCASTILKCCPGVREVTCGHGSVISGLAEGNCSQLEVLRGIYSTEFAGKYLTEFDMKRFVKLSPPLRCIRIEARDEAAAALRMYDSFPSLRIIEIDCSEADAQKGLDLVDVAKKTLRACSTYKPPKYKSARANKQLEETRERLAALYLEPRIVRVIYHPDVPTWEHEYGNNYPPYFYPTRVEEYPV